jgi:hypothetical protein
LRHLLSSLTFCLIAGTAHGAPIGIAQLGGYVHVNGSLQVQLDGSSSGFFSTLDANNFGTFGWSFTNVSSSALQNVLFLAFLDADIDRDVNTFFNEYGQFLGLALPPGAPLGAIAASSWEIDEPGFLFGNIVSHLLAGALDNSNGVPSSSPDDPSFALGFFLPSLGPNQTFRVTLTISASDIGGLRQIDPDSDFQFFLNGAAAVTDGPGTNPVPEPSTLLCMLLGCVGIVARRVLQRS